MTSPSLRPMSLGELLDRVFYLYRTQFLLFLGIIALPNLLVLAMQLASVTTQKRILSGEPGGALQIVWSFATGLVALVVLAAWEGATTVAASQVHLGRTITVGGAYAAVRGRIVSLALILLALGIGIGVGLVLLIIPGIILGLMWSLTFPVAVLEDQGLRDSVERSSALTKGHRGRIFVILVLLMVLTYLVYLLWQIPIFAAIGVFARGNPQNIPLWTLVAIPIGTFLSQCIVGPFLGIALTLVYFDERVRKEALDIQLMMASPDAAQAGSLPPAAGAQA
jgi:hypothetical protein